MRMLCCAVAVVCGQAMAGAADPTLAEVRFGEGVLGRKPTADDLKGKVVLIELWGVNCPPCIATMPHVVRWNEELSEFGLVVIGAHSQAAEPAAVKAVAQRLGMRFPVVQGVSVPGRNGGGLPHTLIFDHTGRQVYDGKPDGADAKLRSAIGAALLAGVSDPPKAIAAVADTLKKGGSPIDALKKLNGLKNDSDKKVAEAAKAIIGKITAVAQDRLDGAKAEMETDPVAAYDAAQFTAVRWQGLPLGTQAKELAGKLKGDKVVVAELKARPTFETVKKLDAVMSARMKDDADAKADGFKKANAAPLKQMAQAYQTLVRQYPDAPATKSAEVIAKKYELKEK